MIAIVRCPECGVPLQRPPLCEHPRPELPLDLDLLRKFASGEGGRRTGALIRAGLIKVTITPEGIERLASYGHGLHFAGDLKGESEVKRLVEALKEPT